LSHQENPPLNLAYVADLFYDLLPITLASFRRMFPATAVNLFDMSCGDQLQAIISGKIDIGFVGLREPIQEAGLEYRPVAAYKTVVALPKRSRLAKRRTIQLENLEPMFFIGMSEKSYPGYRLWLTRTCQCAGFNPRILQDVDAERTILQSVAAGLGVALVPHQLKKAPHGDVVFRPVMPAASTEACIAWKADNSSATLEAFVDLVIAAASGTIAFASNCLTA
jgi:DNA-binding transcriptional LysR family regulator